MSRGAPRGSRGLLTLLALVCLIVSAGGGYLFWKHHTKPSMTPLQRVYLNEYYRSFWRSYFIPFKPQSNYDLLVKFILDPKTKKEMEYLYHDNEVEALLDSDGEFQTIRDVYPAFVTRPEYLAQSTRHGWVKSLQYDHDARLIFRDQIYEGTEYDALFYPSLLFSIFIFIPGLVGASIFTRRRTKRYLKGTPLRGTRELNPKEYERLHRRDMGIGLEVFIPRKGN